MLHAARWTYRTQKKSPKICHVGTIGQFCRAVSSQLRHVSTIGKNLGKQQYFLHLSRPHNMSNVGPIVAEIGLPVWGTPANFNGFRVLALLLQRRRSPEANLTLHDVWPSPGLLHYVYIFGDIAPNGVSPRAKLTLRPSLAFSYIGSVTARHSSSGRQSNFAA